MKQIPRIRLNGFNGVWKQCQLFDIIEINCGMSYKHLGKGSIPVYGTGGYMLSVDTALSKNEDAVGIGRKGTIDRPFILKAPFWTVDTLFYCIPKNDIDLEFTNCLFQSIDWKKKDESTGVPSLSKTIIGCTDVLLPSYDEQRRIGTCFSNYNSIIAFYRKKYEMLGQLKEALLEKMFPIGKDTVPEVRFSGFTESWKEYCFSELYRKVNEKNDSEFGINDVISVASMHRKLDVCIASDDYLKTYNIMRLGDIAFEGNKSKKFAHGRFVENTIGDGIVSHVFDVFRPTIGYDLYFWKYMINNERIMSKILARCTKSSTMMTNLVACDFLKERILVPSIEEQHQIGCFLSRLDNLISFYECRYKKIKSLRESFLSKMLVRVEV